MLFVSATDTNVGKTFFANELIAHLQTERIFTNDEIAYYKPVQSGSPTDVELIQKNNPCLATYNSYSFKTACSPNYAAKLENIIIDLNKIKDDFASIKAKHKFIIVEGAGGLAVPLNETDMVADLAKLLDLPLILVARKDLGTINHTVLSVRYAQALGIRIKGLWFKELINKDFDTRVVQDSIATIEKITKLKRLSYQDLISDE
jgi:dethiobiotin synthetase